MTNINNLAVVIINVAVLDLPGPATLCVFSMPINHLLSVVSIGDVGIDQHGTKVMIIFVQPVVDLATTGERML